MTPPLSGHRCGIDLVDLSRIEKLIADHDDESLLHFFSAEELEYAGDGRPRVQRLAARFAAKEACCKLFPVEVSNGTIEPSDFSVSHAPSGAPVIQLSKRAEEAAHSHGIRKIHLSLSHTHSHATAIAMAESEQFTAPWFGKWLYYLLPIRRGVVLTNMRRVFGETHSEDEIRKLAQAFYAHYARFIGEFVRLPFLSRKRKEKLIRVEGGENLLRAQEGGKGTLLLTGHFGNWEVATVVGVAKFSDYRGLFHFIRKPLKPKWFNDFVMRRFTKAGFGTLEKSGSLDEILDLLERNHIVVSIFDQHAIRRVSVESTFFGHPCRTSKSLAILALNTGAPVMPCSSWREPDGTHVLHFGEPIPLVECDSTSESIRKSTQSYNEALEQIILRHPDQWIWMHKRWKN